MGGGDLNSKKSWHPNTMKNQERVWKAEQAAAEEKKRIAQLQSEHAQEKTREELNEMAKKCSAGLGSTASDDRLHWMYNKPEKSIQQEDYLLGKEIEKSYDQPEKSDIIPAVARRVVGSSMLATAGDAQVDLARKIREDPLLLVKERERAARAALLNNPLHRRRITELLKKEQMQKLNEKNKKKKNLDSMLAEKLNALGKDKEIDLAALLASDSDDSSSENERKSKKKKKKLKKEKKSKEKRAKKLSHQLDSDSDCRVKSTKKKQSPSLDREKKDYDKGKSNSSKRSKSKNRYRNTDSDSEDCRERHRNNKRKSDDEFPERHKKRRLSSSEPSKNISSVDRHKREERKRNTPVSYRSEDGRRKLSPEPERSKSDEFRRRNSQGNNREKRSENPSIKAGLSEKEKLARLAEMAAAGAAREQERSRRVERQREHRREEDRARPAAPAPPALPHSLEARIHSNRHYIQRDKRHMNEHFARR